VRRILVTGMSGTGKSSLLVRLGKLGFQVLDTDHPGWTEWSDSEAGFLWREDRIADLLAGEVGPSLYVSGPRPQVVVETSPTSPLGHSRLLAA